MTAFTQQHLPVRLSNAAERISDVSSERNLSLPCYIQNYPMDYREKALGRNVRFLLPSLKLKQPCPNGDTVEQLVHSFLADHFGGYTATSANLFGYWREEDGGFSYGEHREFTVALTDDEGLPELKDFLGRTATTLGELCLYVEVAGVAMLLYGGAEKLGDRC